MLVSHCLQILNFLWAGASTQKACDSSRQLTPGVAGAQNGSRQEDALSVPCIYIWTFRFHRTSFDWHLESVTGELKIFILGRVNMWTCLRQKQKLPMLKNICKAHKRRINEKWAILQTQFWLFSGSLYLNIVTGALTLLFFFFTFQCFILKNFKHIATSKEFSEHSYTHPSSNRSIFLYLLSLTAIYPLMIIFRLLIYIGKYSSKHVLSECTVLSPGYQSTCYSSFLKLSEEYIPSVGISFPFLCYLPKKCLFICFIYF